VFNWLAERPAPDIACILKKGVRKIDDSIVVNIVHYKIGQDIAEEEKEPAAVNDLTFRKMATSPKNNAEVKKRVGTIRMRKGLKVITEVVGAIAACRLPAQDGTSVVPSLAPTTTPKPTNRTNRKEPGTGPRSNRLL